jgi:flagellar biosynthesis protein FliQ
MPNELVVDLSRRTLEATIWVAAPILIVAVVVSLAVSLLQVLTSLQEMTLSTVPRLAAVGAACFFLMPWMVRRMGIFTVSMFSNFSHYLR